MRQNEQGALGFYLDQNEFLPYLEALHSRLGAWYPLHQERQSVQEEFSDLIVSTGRKKFFQILDVLFAVYGVENFNAEIRDGN